jgi:hypothetical protein
MNDEVGINETAENAGEEMECPYCLAGDVPVQETLPNEEVIMAHWVRGKAGSICVECEDCR